MDKTAIITSQIGNLSQWSWDGGYSYNDPDIADSEPVKCLCGMPLIHCFIISNDETHNTAIVGMECVRLFKKSGRALVRRIKPSSVIVK